MADNKELNNFLLKVANYGNSIFDKSEFNLSSFNNFCLQLNFKLDFEIAKFLGFAER